MSSLMSQLSPSITNMIRLDHTHVLSAFHQYEIGSPVRLKKGLVDNICLAIEIHAQLEEEIFYPALRVVADNEILRKSTPEHDEMRGLISRLRNMPVSDPSFDDTFFELRVDLDGQAHVVRQALLQARRGADLVLVERRQHVRVVQADLVGDARRKLGQHGRHEWAPLHGMRWASLKRRRGRPLCRTVTAAAVVATQDDAPAVRQRLVWLRRQGPRVQALPEGSYRRCGRCRAAQLRPPP
jgi:hypothetical protein